MAPFSSYPLSFSRLGLALALLVAAAGSSCKGAIIGGPTDKCPGLHCHTTAECGPHPDTFCDPTKATGTLRSDPNHEFCCETVERGCGESVDAGLPADQQTNPCCPGQTCSDVAQLCSDSVVGCTSDADCNTALGQYCQTNFTQFPAGAAGCTFHTCTEDANCPAGTGCFNSYCVAAPPCAGHCDPGSVCTPITNACYALGMNASPSCQQTCNTGSLLVFKDGRNVFDFCDHAKTNDCECLAFPNIQTSDAARFSSATLAGENILVSAYDGDHGDLILRTFKKTDQKELGIPEWIDGVPASGAIVGNPAGPRGGIAVPGPDVGRYTSIAYDPSNDTTHISYYAVADGTTPLGNLKYARRTGTGAWTVFTVDGQSGTTDTGDVGLYSAITIAPDHAPVIAYFQKAGVGANLTQTGLKVARAKSASPSSSADFNAKLVEAGTRAAPPCGGQTCPGAQVCVATTASPDGACTTKAAASSCTTACTGSDVCITDGAASSCKAPLTASTLAALPEGNGLMPSLAYLDGLPVVVWYDHNKNVLKGATATADSAAAGATFGPVQTLDDGSVPGSTGATHDVGRFPSLAVGPASVMQRLAVAYMDSTTKQLRLLTAKADWSNQTALDKRVIDNGLSTGADASLFVGANTSLKFIGENLGLVYQDSTGTNLRVAAQTSPTGPLAFSQAVTAPTSPSGRPFAGGFYANLVIDGQNRYATHATVYAKDKSQALDTLQVVKLP